MRKLLLGLIGLLFAIPVFAACPSGQIEQTYTTATGTVVQNGTPTPTNPIGPTFYQQGNMILRKVGNYADSYDATTGKITRRVGEYIVKGTEAWSNYTAGTRRYWFDITTKEPTASSTSVLCNKYHVVSHNGDSSDNWILNSKGSQSIIMKDSRYETPEDWKAYLADQYAAGTPVIIYYPLKEAKYTTEYVGTEWCEGIKIATTAYNATRFSPVVTELNDTIATIRSVVTNTINQTKAIADLQATKQTRPDETCPAGKKCLLVEDNDGTPHWYEIIESASRLPDGFTELEYLGSNSQAYIDTGIAGDRNLTIKCKYLYSKFVAYGAIYGNYIGDSKYGYRGILGGSDNSGIIVAIRSSFSATSAGSANTIDNWHTLVANADGTYYIDGNLVGQVTPDSGNENNIALFNRSLTNPNTSRDIGLIISEFQVEENGTVIQNLVPCRRNSDNVLGMYDTVSGQFFTNQGTGTFTAGPEVQ